MTSHWRSFTCWGRREWRVRCVEPYSAGNIIVIVLRAIDRTRQNGLKDKPVKELNENLPDWSPVSEQMC